MAETSMPVPGMSNFLPHEMYIAWLWLVKELGVTLPLAPAVITPPLLCQVMAEFCGRSFPVYVAYRGRVAKTTLGGLLPSAFRKG